MAGCKDAGGLAACEGCKQQCSQWQECHEKAPPQAGETLVCQCHFGADGLGDHTRLGRCAEILDLGS